MRALRGALPAVAVLTVLAGCGSPASPVAVRSAPPSAGSPLALPAPASVPSISPSGPRTLAAVKGKVILVDPGHNGGDRKHPEIVNQPVPMGTGTKPCDATGTETDSGYQEAAFTFDVATRVNALLTAAGAHVIMTRADNDSVGPCVNIRAKIGNDAHANVAISIHADGAPARGHGFHVMTPARIGTPSDAIIDTSRQLALKIRDSYRARTGIPTSNYIGQDGINVRADMAGLNLSVVPKVLLECGNMRNAGDAAILMDPTHRQRMAEGIAEGLAAYLASVR